MNKVLWFIKFYDWVDSNIFIAIFNIPKDERIKFWKSQYLNFIFNFIQFKIYCITNIIYQSGCCYFFILVKRRQTLSRINIFSGLLKQHKKRCSKNTLQTFVCTHRNVWRNTHTNFYTLFFSFILSKVVMTELKSYESFVPSFFLVLIATLFVDFSLALL